MYILYKRKDSPQKCTRGGGDENEQGVNEMVVRERKEENRKEREKRKKRMRQ